MKSAAAVVALLLIGLPTTAAAQEEASPGDPPVFRTGTSLVTLNVTVTDPQRQFVRGLTADDFAIFEDGAQQEVEFFEALDVPKDLIILIDASSSMRDKMAVVHEAAIGFLRTLRGGDRGAVVTFHDAVDIVQGLTGDGEALEQAVRRTAGKGATALYNALYISLREFGQGATVSGAIRRQAIVVLTDGEDTSSLIGYDDVLSAARKSGVSVYPIGIHDRPLAAYGGGPRRGYSGTDYSLRELARETGAQAFFPDHVSDLKGVYEMIAQELSSQYSLAYAPANARPDGILRRIVVRVATRPELRLRTRTGYMVQAARTAALATFLQER